MRSKRNIQAIFCIILAVCMTAAAACKSGTPKKPEYLVAGYNGSHTKDKVGFQFDMPKDGETIVVFHTSMGDIRARLFKDSAPIAVTNFEALVDTGYYNGLKFHRVISDFMIQGGDPSGDGTGGKSIWGEGFAYEFNENLRHFTGALSMAHSDAANSNGSQFFVVQGPKVTEETLTASGLNKALSDEVKTLYYEHGGTPHLDGSVNKSGHTVFGQVFDGMDIVNKIAAVETDENDMPVTDIIMNSVELVKYTSQ